jgi:rhodanese-related sulfurtransferase
MLRAALILLAAMLMAGCATTGGSASTAVRDVTAQEAIALVNSGQVVPIDMRSPHEFKVGHIPGAVHVPFGSEGTARQVKRAIGGKQALVYSRTGERSGIALPEFAGLQGVLHLRGGITEWKAKGGQIAGTIAAPEGRRTPVYEEPKTEVYKFF